MPSALKSFCCFCEDSRERGYEPSYSRQLQQKKNKKTKSRVKQGNGRTTWTRKSLLENEDMDFIDGHITEAYQMNTFKSNEDKLMKEHEQFIRRLENDSVRKKRSVQDLFPHGPVSPSTTFPWMDEKFSSNGRSTTHLGISSVKISAKRNELATRGSNVNDSNQIRYGKDHPLYDRVQKADAVKPPTYFSLPKPTLQNLKTNPNGKGFGSNFSIATNNHHGMIAGSVSAVISGDRPIVYRETKSDVGVRRVSSNTSAYNRDTRIPKLCEYKGTSGNVSATWGTSSKGLNQKDTCAILNKFNENIYQNRSKENASDISFSTEFTLRKPDVTYVDNYKSLQRKTQPNIFSTKKENHEKFLQVRSKSNNKKNKNYVNLPESMYGYVPKAVQNVHASNALEGNKIDDFFFNRLKENDLEKFAKVSTKNSVHEDDIVLIDSIMEECNIPDSEIVKKPTIYQNTEPENTDQLKIEKLKSKVGSESFETKSHVKTSMSANKVDVCNTGSINGKITLMSKDKNDDMVIMIDFPPKTSENDLENIEERSDVPLVTSEVKPNDSKLVDVEVLY